MRWARWSSAVSTVRWTPSQANTAIRMMKAIATQVSGWLNIRLSLHRGVDGLLDRGRIRRGAGEPLHDGAGCVGRDALDVAHRGRPRRGDLLLGIGKLDGELILQRLAFGFRGGVELL